MLPLRREIFSEKPTETLPEEDLIIVPAGHRYLHFDKEEAQCEIYGMEEHYECKRCGSRMSTIEKIDYPTKCFTG